MNYKEAREYLKNVNKFGSVLGLESISELLGRLENPQDSLRVVHIAGTNGKGSTMAFLQSILIEAGYSVGRYSSPAVFNEREIIQFNYNYIEENEFADILSVVKEKCNKMVEEGFSHPTAFEIETALAFLYFKEKKCDIVLVECGMGGETDATNVFHKVLCSIITTISLDHMGFLGETIEKITMVKAGIVKEGCPVVMASQTSEAENVVRRKSQNNNAELKITGKPFNIKTENLRTFYDYKASNGKNYSVELKALGTYQIINSVTAIESAITLEEQGFNLENYIEQGLRKTIWHGRFEVIHENPLIVIDGAHNPGAVKELAQSIDLYFTNERITFIMGVLADKDFVSELELIGNKAVKIITVTPDNPRALSAEELTETVKRYNKNVCMASSVMEAAALAGKTVKENESDMILAFGSLSYLGAFKEAIMKTNS